MGLEQRQYHHPVLTDTMPFLSYIELAILNYIQKKIYSHKKRFLRKDFDIKIMKDIGLFFNLPYS